MLQEMIADHEIDFHSNLEVLAEEDMFMDKTNFREEEHEPLANEDKFNDAMNMLNSFGKLQYGFYEMYKPIGNSSNGRYLKVKMSTDGRMDVSGVVGLGDCELVHPEHGSMEYLRQLNTGNRRYRLLLSRPFNDLHTENPNGSILWWKPDKPEQLQLSED